MERIRNTIILTILSTYLVALAVRNDLGYYLNERYFGLSVVTSVLLVIISVTSLIFFIKHDIFDKKSEKESVKKLVKLILKDAKIYLFLLIIPLAVVSLPIFILASIAIIIPWKSSVVDGLFKNYSLFSFIIISFIFAAAIFIPAKALSQQTVDQREGSLNSFSGISDAQSLVNLFNSDTKNFSIKDWISLINTQGSIYTFEGKEADVTGFIYKRDNLDSSTFMVARFVVSCCVIDATPVGLYVELENWENDLKTEQWVEVTGTLQVKKINGSDSLVIIADEVKPTEEPDRPYI